MLTGAKPYDGDTAMAVIIQHQQAPVPSLPASLTRYQPCIDKMMAKRPEDRFDSVEEILDWQPAIDGVSRAGISTTG
jgi:serine/threonine-protein kinase PpkA